MKILKNDINNRHQNIFYLFLLKRQNKMFLVKYRALDTLVRFNCLKYSQKYKDSLFDTSENKDDNIHKA